MKNHDKVITLKIPGALKIKLEDEAKQKGITLSEIIRRKINNVKTYNNEDIPSISLKGDRNLEFKRCPRCNGIFFPKHTTQRYCCNGCGCNKPCICGAVDRQRLLII